ncbi:CBS domain-containing protein [Chryseobacterium koreense]|uniref:Acetoin utilization protein n=1 Tax=Chryseobacterium koreense CCUG 49689 TaxID=1304281 RepID=A0A0J7J1J1_9FLAO|nr:CBS domain-containing protein [Chryseobacterium koreense]KMQ72107.1 acetoin utilization protein [Chryseobacterium koreense CCUG 49689]MBB5332013.1 CBS domain-containing protein [Chryseobacterium koreense]
MFIKDYISKDYPAFNVNDSIEEANETAKEFGYSHVFVKKKGIFQGALSQSFLEESPEGNLSSLAIHFEKFAILEDSHFFDSIKLFHTFSANVVPVINKQEKYLGYISTDDVFSELSKYPLVSEMGAMLIVQVHEKNYSMTEVCKIVESNNSKIYGCYLSAIVEDEVRITVKISSNNLTSIDETFERYGYSVVHKYYDDEKEELLKDRFGFFQKYLEF